MIEENLKPEARERCYFFSSFFYKKLVEKTHPGKRGKQAAAAAAAAAATGVDGDGGGGGGGGSGPPAKQDVNKLNHERVKRWTKVGRVLCVVYIAGVPSMISLQAAPS